MLFVFRYIRLPAFLSVLGVIALNQWAVAQLIEPRKADLAEVVTRLQDDGLSIIYSSALISPGLEVELDADNISLDRLAKR